MPPVFRIVTVVALTAGVAVTALLVAVRHWWLAVIGLGLWGLTSTIVIEGILEPAEPAREPAYA